MKSTLDRLSDNEKEALAHLYELPGFKALVKVCKLEIEGLALDALTSANHETTKFLNGQAVMAEKLPKIVRELYREINKES